MLWHISTIPKSLLLNLKKRFKLLFDAGAIVVNQTDAYHIVEEAKAGTSGLGKRVRLVMSHKSGKIEILAIQDGKAYLKYHQEKKEIMVSLWSLIVRMTQLGLMICLEMKDIGKLKKFNFHDTLINVKLNRVQIVYLQKQVRPQLLGAKSLLFTGYYFVVLFLQKLKLSWLFQ